MTKARNLTTNGWMKTCSNCNYTFEHEFTFCANCGEDSRIPSSKLENEKVHENDPIKKYFISNENKKHGPYTFEALKNQSLSRETLIWFQGIDDWTKAESVPELIEIFEEQPPPIPPKLTRQFSKLRGETTEETISPDSDRISEINEESNNLNQTKGDRPPMFTQRFSFDGRIRRTEYGISLIIAVFIYWIISALANSNPSLLWFLPYFFNMWFILAQGAKRCHDMGMNAWWQIVPFFSLVMLFLPGEAQINDHGEPA